jgi:orotidine-5'-phosphate decarboxylase
VNFIQKLKNAVIKNNSLLCIGLDPDSKLMPAGISVRDFNKAIIEVTGDLVCAYKPNLAFYEALGLEGMNILSDTIKYIPPDIPVIADAKRSDIGNTAQAYATALFSFLKCDAATVNPYLGYDSLEPFINYHDKGIFILCRTSNAGARDFQSLRCETGNGSRSLYEIVALKAQEWNTHGNIGLVIGATYPEELKSMRQEHPDIPILIPGVGAQGGELGLAVRYGVSKQGDKAIINSSRQVLYASRGKDFARAAREKALSLRDEMNRYRSDAVKD